MPRVTINKMTQSHYPSVVKLWQSDAGIGVGLGDEKAGISRYLKRNPGMSFIARFQNRIVGTILAGHDGRRGYIYHLFVVSGHRKKQIGNQLLEAALNALKGEGIPRCIVTVLKDNKIGNDFWRAKAWTNVDFVNVFSTTLVETDP